MRSWLLIFFADFVIDCILITLFVLVIYLFFPSIQLSTFLFIYIYLSIHPIIYFLSYLIIFKFFILWIFCRSIRRLTKNSEEMGREVSEGCGAVCCLIVECGMSCAVVWWSAVLYAVCCLMCCVPCAIVMCCVTLCCTREEYAYIRLKYTKE